MRRFRLIPNHLDETIPPQDKSLLLLFLLNAVPWFFWLSLAQIWQLVYNVLFAAHKHLFYPIKSLPSLISLDSAFQMQEYISLLIRLDVHDVNSIVSLPSYLVTQNTDLIPHPNNYLLKNGFCPQSGQTKRGWSNHSPPHDWNREQRRDNLQKHCTKVPNVSGWDTRRERRWGHDWVMTLHVYSFLLIFCKCLLDVTLDSGSLQRRSRYRMVLRVAGILRSWLGTCFEGENMNMDPAKATGVRSSIPPVRRKPDRIVGFPQPRPAWSCLHQYSDFGPLFDSSWFPAPLSYFRSP